MARKAGCSTLVVLSKWDDDRGRRSRTSGRGSSAPAPAAAADRRLGEDRPRARPAARAQSRRLYEKHTARIPTPELNHFLARAREARQPPSRRGKRLNLLYGAQVSTRPPRFRFPVNDPGLVTRDYAYWVENELRERFELEGVPVSIDFVERS